MHGIVRKWWDITNQKLLYVRWAISWDVLLRFFFGYIKPIIYVDLWGYDGTCGCLESGAPKLLAALDMMFRSVLAGILCQTFVPEIYG